MTQRLPPELRWIAFDLDDTLHYFKRASGTAAEAVFRDIEERLGIGVNQMAETYRKVLRSAQSSHFAEAKTSREYRAERFGALLDGFGVDPSLELDRVLDLSDAALGEAFELEAWRTPGTDLGRAGGPRGDGGQRGTARRARDSDRALGHRTPHRPPRDFRRRGSI